MAIEIERKFLVIGNAWRAAVTQSKTMRQGYLVGEGGRSSIRVRVAGEDARLNIKAAVVGAARAEYDYPVPLADAQEILDTLCVGRVDKTRHYAPACSSSGAVLTWEIDEFAGANAGLIVAELELSSVDQGFDRPAWLGAEVTEYARYYNHALALHPYRDWTDDDRNAAAEADTGDRSEPAMPGRA
jgi:adenylate cyclase